MTKVSTYALTNVSRHSRKSSPIYSKLYGIRNKDVNDMCVLFFKRFVPLVLSKEVGLIQISTHAVKRRHMNMPVTTAFIKCFSFVQIAIIGFSFNL